MISKQHNLSRRDAYIIYGWLIFVTLAEVGIVMSGVTKVVGSILMTGTSIAKVLMIGLNFMHIRHDRPVAWLLPVIPLLLAVFFVAVLFPDIVYHLPLHFH